MAKIVTYVCDLCDDDLNSAQDNGDVSVSWNAAAKMELHPLWPIENAVKADSHLCRVCVNGLREALKEVNDVAG